MIESRLNNCGCVDYEKTAELIKEVDVLADALKKSILEAKDEIKVSGKTYYVSEKGDDANDGLSKTSPIKTNARVSELELCPGDAVLFERGGIFRGNITAKAGVTYAAYGEGKKPRIYGSPENGADPAKWTLLEGTDNIWIYEKRMCDVGVLVFDEKQSSIKRIPSFIDGKYVLRSDRKTPFDIKKHLNKDLCHFCDNSSETDKFGLPCYTQPIGVLYLRCDKGNPGEVFKSIEFNVRPNVIRISGNNIHIDNLAIMFGGCHGVGAGTVTGLHVTNCEIGWIGGCIQFYHTSGEYIGNVVRYGNGIEIYGGCVDYLCDRNYIYQCYDAGVTHQLSAGGDRDCKQKDVTYSNNLIEYCTYSYEYFLGKTDAHNCVRFQKNIRVVNNIMRYAGFGFGEQRYSPANYFPAAHVKGWDHHNYLDDGYVIENNIFDRSRDMMLHCCAIKGEYLPEMRKNIYIQYNDAGSPYFGRYGIVGHADNFDIRYDENIRNVMNERNIDLDGGVYFAKKDELFELEDYLPKTDRI